MFKIDAISKPSISTYKKHINILMDFLHLRKKNNNKKPKKTNLKKNKDILKG